MIRLFRILALAFATLSVSCTRLTPTIAEVSGRKVEVVEAGAGEITVVFEAGLGNDWTSWDELASEVAGGARVFAYSRPGYGRSAPSTEAHSASRTVEELRALLAARGFSPPYILVGHSFGGAYMELFAKAHPEEVAGLVLVDTRHRDFTSRCESAGLSGCSMPASLLPSDQRAEFEAFSRVSAEIEAAGPFGRYPVRVLTSTAHGFSPDTEALWESMLGSLAGEASDGEQVVFAGASHNLQVERPREIAQLILGMK
jgi:pimeloyl-ACP methyl ester carboxylesterase